MGIIRKFQEGKLVANYVTKQRKLILRLFTDHVHEIFTVSQIIEALQEKSVSASAVYRNLAELAESGEIRKIGKAGTREACYQYAGAEDCKYHIHLFCSKCEQSIHMNEEKMELLVQMMGEEDFIVDRNKTIIWGTCRDCK